MSLQGFRPNWFNSMKNGNVSRSNVLTPLNWLIPLVELLLLGGCLKAEKSYIVIVCLCLMVILVLFYLCAYVYFALRDPDRLQSETYNIKMKEITLFTQGDGDIPTFSADNKNIPILKSNAPLLSENNLKIDGDH